MNAIKWQHASTYPETMANSYPPERAKAIYTKGFLTPYDTPNHHRDTLAYLITEAAHDLWLIEYEIGGRGRLTPCLSKYAAIQACEDHLNAWMLKCGLRPEPDATTIWTHRLAEARATAKKNKASHTTNDFQRRANAKEIADCETALAALSEKAAA